VYPVVGSGETLMVGCMRILSLRAGGTGDGLTEPHGVALCADRSASFATRIYHFIIRMTYSQDATPAP
jgi:hypothetical protein